ncbi:MAG: DNA-binding protein [Desulfotomaculaceae bacterium]|nr:DNA-binding protein [Desulfotomaculaceae bacterium]
MKYTQASPGRVFVIRLEQGDIIPGVIEEFALQQKISAAYVLFVGGAEVGSKVVVGPKAATDHKPVPVVTALSGISEAVGYGTIFANQDGLPRLHLHAAFGRERDTITGCARQGVTVWHIGEVVIQELLNCPVQRRVHPQSGLELLEI